MLVLDLFCFHHLVALSFSGSHQSVFDNSEHLRNDSENIGLGLLLPLLATQINA